MLHGDRVTLRVLRRSDYPLMLRAYNDVELELLGGGRAPRPVTLDAVTESFETMLKDTDLFTFAIEVDDAFVGHCGLSAVNRVAGTAEVGIGLIDHALLGRGLGRQALELLVDYGFRIQNLRRLWLEVNGSNPRAIRCYRAVGFVEEGRLRQHVWSAGAYDDLVVMGLLRDQDRCSSTGRPVDDPSAEEPTTADPDDG